MNNLWFNCQRNILNFWSGLTETFVVPHSRTGLLKLLCHYILYLVWCADASWIVVYLPPIGERPLKFYRLHNPKRFCILGNSFAEWRCISSGGLLLWRFFVYFRIGCYPLPHNYFQICRLSIFCYLNVRRQYLNIKLHFF